MSINFLKIKCKIIFSETLDKPKNVPETLVCGTPKRPRLVLSPWGVVAIIFTTVTEGDLVGCVLVNIVASFTAQALSVADVVITLVPHHCKVIALVQRVFQSTLARNGGVGVVGTIPAINRAMNVLFHLTLPRFPFARNRTCRTCFHRCWISKSSHIADSS